MIRANHIGPIMLAACLITSCDGNRKRDDVVHSFLNSTTLQLSKFKDKVLIIIPIDGCSGCVTTTAHFIKTNQDSLLFCIVSSPTRKEARIQLGELLNNEHVFIDVGLKARLAGIVSYYPVVFYMEADRTIAQEMNATNVETELSHLKLKLKLWHERAVGGN
jgi:hypothetical protein